MKKQLILVTLLFFVGVFTFAAKASYETDFKAFTIGDPPFKVATFKLIGEEKTMAVWELKDFLTKAGYGHFFADDKPEDGYTLKVDKAFKEYAESYQKAMKKAEEELNKANAGKIQDGS